MQPKKSFLEIFTDAISTFKNAFWEIFLTYCFSFPFLAIMYYTLKGGLQPYQPTQASPLLLILLIPYLYGVILLQTWQILIIKGNIFTGVNNLLQTLKKALLKALQVYVVSIIFIVTLIFLVFITAKAFPSCVKVMPLLTIPLIPFVLLFFGIILQDGKFMNILINSIAICITNYFRILGYVLLLMLISFVVMILVITLSIIPLFLFFVIVLVVLINMMAQPFYSCFLVELYFDLVLIDEERPLEDLTEVSKSYPDIVDINQSQEEKAKQQNPKNEIPEGLQQLGGDYNNKK